jgi:glycosyltransferase involved in cell wall biosynthesis
MNFDRNINPDSNDNGVPDTSPLVTIGITNYNSSDYLDECITSILNQSYKPIEIIIVDDNSQDDSIEKLKKLEAIYKNIIIIYHKENSGSPDLGRQEIISSANGDYFMLVDSDDYFAVDNTVGKLVEEFKNTPDIDYVYCNMIVVDKASKPTGLWVYKQYNDSELIKDIFRRGGSGVIPMKGLFRRDFFIKNNLSWHNNESAGDTLTALVNTKHGWRYKYLNLDLLCYRQYGESFTYNLEKRVKAISKILDYIVDNFNEEIYVPDVPWNQFDNMKRANVKTYLLGKFYIEIYKAYCSQWSSQYKADDKKEPDLIKCLEPLKNKALHYLNKFQE